MAEKITVHAEDQLVSSPIQQRCYAPVTIFTIPKPFIGDSTQIQSNAIRSWASLAPAVDVFLIGDEPGIEEFATEHDLAHFGEVQRNASGTPLVSSAFRLVREVSSSPTLVYCNADVILDSNFVSAMEALSSQNLFERWLAIGHRTNLAVNRMIDFADKAQVDWLHQEANRKGRRSSAVCKEYFAFNRGLFDQVPPFAVGRGNWDNWMVASAKSNGIPVIDLSQVVSVIHQDHDYAHMKSTRMSCYVSGAEARENERLAGGRNLISGTTCTHRLGANGIEPISRVGAILDFASDLPRFAKLMSQLLFGR